MRIQHKRSPLQPAPAVVTRDFRFAMFFPKVGATPCLQFAKKKNCIYFIETDHLKRREMHLALCIRRYSWKWFSWSIFSCNIFFRSNRIFQVPKKKRSRWLSPFKDINVVLYYLKFLKFCQVVTCNDQQKFQIFFKHWMDRN